MKPLVKQMAFYHQHHTQVITKLTHFIGVPMIIFALLCFLMIVLPAWVTFLGVLLLCFYYFYLDALIGGLTSIVLALITWLSWTVVQLNPSWWIVGGVFIAGWALQFLGHWYEKSKPAFFSNIMQIFIAPIFLVAEICFLLGFKKKLEQQIHDEGEKDV